MDSVHIRPKLTKQATAPATYRYSGPPSVQINTWKSTGRSIVSLKEDSDYVIGVGQQDPKVKSPALPTSTLVHSESVSKSSSPATTPTVAPAPRPAQYTPKVSTGESQKKPPLIKSASLASPVNMSIITSSSINKAIWEEPTDPQSTTGMKTVLSTWQKKVEETSKAPTPKKFQRHSFISKDQDHPPEIDLYGPLPSEPVLSKAPVVMSVEPKVTVTQTTGRTMVNIKKMESGGVLANEESKPVRPISFTMSNFESSTLPRPSKERNGNNTDPSIVDVVDSAQKYNTLQERKSFFQGVKPVEKNGKETPVPAVNMKNNIATIQKVFEARKSNGQSPTSPNEQYPGSRQTFAPVVSNMMKNSAPESSNSSVVSSMDGHESPGKLSIGQPLSSTMMVQKLLGVKQNSFGGGPESFRRSPSPISSTTSTVSNSNSSERFTPSPTIMEGPNHSIRISNKGPISSSAGAKNMNDSIKNDGNKAIILVHGGSSTDEMGTSGKVSNSIFKQKLKIESEVKPAKKQMETPVKTSSDKKELWNQKAVVVEELMKKKIQPKESTAQLQEPASVVKRMSLHLDDAASSSSRKESFASRKESLTSTNDVQQGESRKMSVKGGAGPPPAPPLPTPEELRTVEPAKSNSLSSIGKSKSMSSMGSNKNPASPTSGAMAGVLDAIKNSNGEFKLKRVSSSYSYS